MPTTEPPTVRRYSDSYVATTDKMWHRLPASPATLTACGLRVDPSERWTIPHYPDDTWRYCENCQQAGTVTHCAACGAYNALQVTQEAWGDRYDCLACGHSRFYSIGD